MPPVMVEWVSEEVLGLGDALLWLSRAGSSPMSSAHRPCPPKRGSHSEKCQGAQPHWAEFGPASHQAKLYTWGLLTPSPISPSSPRSPSRRTEGICDSIHAWQEKCQGAWEARGHLHGMSCIPTMIPSFLNPANLETMPSLLAKTPPSTDWPPIGQAQTAWNCRPTGQHRPPH